MLAGLRVRNYAVIEDLDLDLPEGFVVFTGETGAGKSIVVGALALVLGGRARPEPVEGSEKLLPATALIFAFGYRPSPPEWLNAIGVDTDETGLVRPGGGLAGQTSNPSIFAAGDMVRGSDLVVTAIADAREAALSIIQHLELQQPKLKRA